ncbi:hypothetical protein Aduo_011447 [Ancylostoma duodenale]
MPLPQTQLFCDNSSTLLVNNFYVLYANKKTADKIGEARATEDAYNTELIQEGELASGSSKGSSGSGSRPASKTPLAAKKKQQPRKVQATKAAKTKPPPPRPPQTPHRTRDNEPAFDPFQQRADPGIIKLTPITKLERIAKGEKKDKDAYPTLGDVPSDWDDEPKEVFLSLQSS